MVTIQQSEFVTKLKVGAEAKPVAVERVVGLTSASHVEAKPAAAERVVGLTSESQVAAERAVNVVLMLLVLRLNLLLLTWQ